MSCEEFWNRMAESAQDCHAADDLTGHSVECAVCAARLANQSSLNAGLRALAAELRLSEAPMHVEARLITAFRTAHPLAARRRAAWWKMPVLPWAMAGVATVALVFSVWTAPKRQTHAPAARHAMPPRVELAALSTEETDDGFIPLPNAPQIDPSDEVNVVRMELPRSAMLTVGLEVSPDQVSDKVEAEVMLGPDGLARAVRFME